MARRQSSAPPEDFTEKIIDIDVEAEMEESFLEYAYSVIYSRALPDARDGLLIGRSHRRVSAGLFAVQPRRRFLSATGAAPNVNRK